MRTALIVIVLMALSFGGAFWWQHEKVGAVQAKLDTATAQLSEAKTRVRLFRLQDQLFSLMDETANQNYGNAAALSTKFFNNLNNDVSSVTQPQMKSAMQSILAQRDQVTAELAKGDPAAHDAFVQMSKTFRQVLHSTAFQPTTSTP